MRAVTALRSTESSVAVCLTVIGPPPATTAATAAAAAARPPLPPVDVRGPRAGEIRLLRIAGDGQRDDESRRHSEFPLHALTPCE